MGAREQAKCIVSELLQKSNCSCLRNMLFLNKMDLLKYSLPLGTYIIKNKECGSVMGFISFQSSSVWKNRNLYRILPLAPKVNHGKLKLYPLTKIPDEHHL